MKKPPKNKALTVKVSKGLLTIEIGVDTLAHSAIHSPWASDLAVDLDVNECFYVSTPTSFAREVRG